MSRIVRVRNAHPSAAPAYIEVEYDGDPAQFTPAELAAALDRGAKNFEDTEPAGDELSDTTHALILARRKIRRPSSGGVLPTLEIGQGPRASLAVGGTLQLTALVSDGAAPVWVSDNEAVASVSQAGLVTWVAAGTATITATHPSAPGVYAVIEITALASVPVGQFAVFPDPRLEFLMGPLVVAGDGLMNGTSQTTHYSPWPYYDLNLARDLAITGPNFPYHAPVEPADMPGTITIKQGETAVLGHGTEFTKYIEPAGGRPATYSIYVQEHPDSPLWYYVAATQHVPNIIASVSDDTHMELTEPWPYPDATNVAFATSLQAGTPGKVWIEAGDTEVTGSGTRFLDYQGQSIALYVYDEPAGTWRVVPAPALASVQSNTKMTLAEPWPYPSVAGVVYTTTADGDKMCYHGKLPINERGTQYPGYWNYYDQTLSQYIEYFRTLDPQYKANGRRIARSYATYHKCLNYTTTGRNGGLDVPRQINLSGHMIQAIMDDLEGTGDGPGGISIAWDWIEQATDWQLGIWVYKRLANPLPYQGIRDGAMMTAYAAKLAFCLPDSYPCTIAHDGYLPGDTITDGAARRARLREQVATLVTEYYARLQYPDGSWRYKAGEATAPFVTQVFQHGLVLEAMFDAYRLLHGDPQYSDAAETAKQVLIKGARWVRKVGYDDSYPIGANPATDVRWRRGWYTVYDENAASAITPGTVTLTQGSKEVVGVGTQFLADLDAEYLPIWFAVARSGTVAVTKGGTKVLGTGTQFLTEFAVGDYFTTLRADGTRWMGHILSIESNTELTMSYEANMPTESGMGIEWLSRRRAASGTVSVTSGSKSLTGAGTAFLDELAPYGAIWLQRANGELLGNEVRAIEANGAATMLVDSDVSESGMKLLRVADHVETVTDNTHLTLCAPWDRPSCTAKVLMLKSPGAEKPVMIKEGWTKKDPSGWRQNYDTCMAPMGQAYLLSGLSEFREWGDELFSAYFGAGVGPGADRENGLSDYIAPGGWRRTKELNQAHRTSGRYLAHRLGRLF